MKCRILLVFVFSGLVFNAFGIDLSVGSGISYSPLTSKWIFSNIGFEGTATDHYNFGAINLYLDATYIQAIINYSYRFSGSYNSTGVFTGSGEYTNKETFLGVSILLKYPFVFGWFSFFPLVGIESDLNLSYTDKDGNDLKSGMPNAELDNLNKHFLKVGVGGNIKLSKRIYMSPVFIFGYKMPSRIEKNIEDYYWLNYGLTNRMRTTKFDIVFFAGYRL